jgi:hypothetical protein
MDVNRLSIHVENDQGLDGMTIPLSFGEPEDPILLDRVEWSERVADWEVTNASIDNKNKTVILGLISELTETRDNAELAASIEGNARIATLVFRISGEYRPSFTTFTTEYPTHELMFFYNEYVDGKPHVREFVPVFVVDSSEE